MMNGKARKKRPPEKKGEYPQSAVFSMKKVSDVPKSTKNMAQLTVVFLFRKNNIKRIKMGRRIIPPRQTRGVNWSK